MLGSGYRWNREHRREQILKIASELFSEKSYHDVTVDEIADKVGIAKDDPAPIKLKKVLSLIFDFYRRNLDVLRILSRDETHLIREHYEFTEHWKTRRIKLYEKILEKGQREGSFRPVNVRLAALIIFGLVRSVIFYYKAEKTAGQVAEEVFSVISEGILAKSRHTFGGSGL